MKKAASPGRLSEGVKLIFDKKAPHGRRSSRSSSSSSSSDSSFSSSKGGRSSHRSRSSSSDSGSSSPSHSRSRSRSHPRCSGRSCCRHRRHSPPRRYRARSRSYSPSPERSSHRRRYHRRSRSPSPYSYSRRYMRSPSRSRSRSRSPVYWRGSRFVGRYRCRFSRSPRSSRDYRSRSRSCERSTVCLSLEEKKYLLNVAKANAARILGVQNLELPASLKELEEEEEEEKRRSSSDKEERVSADWAPQKIPAQVNVANDDGEAEASPTSPKRKPINFSINNTIIARPSNSPTVHDSKVTSRADSVADRKPYGQWVPISRSSSKK
ncbi:arginine/serine-rich protein 1-like isoform X3 [Sinocyclocheilus anshuiensis]|uniref:arginine/serine-rich protein 1-like isoform X2 n=1 Tax=Sinocyclocheilus anshuiensis TaxID=1608454 RepID=UPI0007BA3766|nr:PREDICTED: arginine/serine-rich protein 1-like isoform X2 [Sinocyclocheilus anshuiensis]XP_016330113.1 PREDICTED: arginine/serine-rich protein 1-like isoform X3 [Sinocyclocheilus anshuiensis]